MKSMKFCCLIGMIESRKKCNIKKLKVQLKYSFIIHLIKVFGENSHVWLKIILIENYDTTWVVIVINNNRKYAVISGLELNFNGFIFGKFIN